jgi:hypothetical protein
MHPNDVLTLSIETFSVLPDDGNTSATAHKRNFFPLLQRASATLFKETGEYPYELLCGLHAANLVESLPRFSPSFSSHGDDSPAPYFAESGKDYWYRGSLHQFLVYAIRPEALDLTTILLWTHKGKIEIRLKDYP